MKQNKVKKIILVSILVFSLPVFLLLTNPETLPLPLLVVPNLLVFVILFTLFNILIKSVGQEMPDKRRKVIACLLAVFPTLIIVLQSLRQLTWSDFIIVVLIFIPLSWYLLKIDYLSKN